MTKAEGTEEIEPANSSRKTERATKPPLQRLWVLTETSIKPSGGIESFEGEGGCKVLCKENSLWSRKECILQVHLFQISLEKTLQGTFTAVAGEQVCRIYEGENPTQEVVGRYWTYACTGTQDPSQKLALAIFMYDRVRGAIIAVWPDIECPEDLESEVYILARKMYASARAFHTGFCATFAG